MLHYRSHVFDRYVTAMGTAFSLRRTFLEWEAVTGPKEQELGTLRTEYTQLTGAIEALLSALPDDALDSLKNSGLKRHLSCLDRRLREGKPRECTGDAIDITDRDLPFVWKTFEEWFERNSSSDEDFVRKVDRLLNIGQGDSAIRKGWAVFKSRLVSTYGLDGNLDGVRLADAIFGDRGVARDHIPNAQCEGYLNLFKGLYALNRNEVAHNDVTVDPQETEAVLMLLNSMLAHVVKLTGEEE